MRFNHVLALLVGQICVALVGATILRPGAEYRAAPDVVAKAVEVPVAPAEVPPADAPVLHPPPAGAAAPDPAMLAFAAGASNRSVGAANVHIAKSLEVVRLDAVRRGTNPDAAAEQFLAQEVKHWRFISWHAIAINSGLRLWQRAMRWWLAQMSTGPAYIAPVSVPGTHGLLWQLDLRDYRWNASAWRAVALREPYTRAVVDEFGRFVGVDIHQIDLLQRFIGEKRFRVTERLLVNGIRKDVDTFPAIGVVRADWLFRETLETDRSPSYYDLLYARKRFPRVNPEPETYTERVPQTVRQQVYDARYGGYVWHEYTSYTTVTRTRPAKPVDQRRAAVDFPKTRKDWDDFWGVSAIRDYAKKVKFDLRYGAVVPGSRDDPRGGSIVARNNRVVAFWSTGALETIDVARTKRGEDFVEQPVEVSLDQIEGDNGEFLAPLPNGGQAALLIAANRRVEFATGRFVHPKFADQRNPDVRTPQCFVCHAASGGVIAPRNLFDEYARAGIELKINSRVKRNQVRAFMLNWEHRLAGWQAPYLRLIERATFDVDARKPLTPQELIKEMLALRNWYDDPVSAAQAAWELGLPKEVFQGAAARSTTARVLALGRGIAVPRETWERDVYLGLVYGGAR